MSLAEKKIGVLLPQSNAYPTIGKDFLNGLRLGLGNNPPQITVESIGLGSDIKQMSMAAQKLVFQENVSLTTGLVGDHGFSALTDFYTKNDEVLLVATLGSQLPLPLPEGVFQNSFGLARSLKVLGAYLSKDPNLKIATSTSYFDAGYGFLSALENGLNSSQNLEVVGHFITPHTPREDEAELMSAFFKDTAADTVVAFHNGVFAKEHASYLQKNEQYKDKTFYCLPFSCEDAIVKEFPEVAEKFNVVSSWYPELSTRANETFVNSYVDLHKKLPSVFALLGYENGLAIAAALSQNHGLSEALKELNIEGPRGTINFQKDTNSTSFIPQFWNVKLVGEEVKREINNAIKLDQFQEENPLANQPINGWFNAYLCH
jgi:ABC-type branched-subunit amino acid transport system substrate-binding protein